MLATGVVAHDVARRAIHVAGADHTARVTAIVDDHVVSIAAAQ